jgi:hypothetical protein
VGGQRIAAECAERQRNEKPDKSGLSKADGDVVKGAWCRKRAALNLHITLIYQ